MMQYPSIVGSKFAPLGSNCTAFYKYDGSNLRWEWNKKQGWHKYGTRRQLFDRSTELYNQAIEPFQDVIGPGILAEIKNLNASMPPRITAFTEFFGASSFAGSHVFEEPKELKLFDVFLFQKGFIKHQTFAELFSIKDWGAKVVYEGDLTPQFIQDVREGIYPVVEGVICKGDDFTVKIKTSSYLEKLKAVYSNDWENYAE